MMVVACTVELYTASYTGKLLYNSRNGPIQRTFIVPRMCIAIQLYSARVYSRAIQYTAYTLYSPIRRPSGLRSRPGSCRWRPFTYTCYAAGRTEPFSARVPQLCALLTSTCWNPTVNEPKLRRSVQSSPRTEWSEHALTEAPGP